jgi:methanogenic corrinoid protein MtbC1
MGTSTELVTAGDRWAGDRWSDAELAHAPAGRRGEPNRQRAALLARAVERDVVPRLLIAHRRSSLAVAAAPRCPPGAGDIARMAGLVLASDLPAQDDLVHRLQARGMTVESLYLDLLAPAARRLGEMWEQDLCDFTEVTVGLWRLQHILRELGRAAMPPAAALARGRRILLVPVPGEQHTFGLAMVGEFFHRAGWQVGGGAFATVAELAGAVRHARFDVVGISVGCGDRLEAVATAVRAVRRGARDSAIPVMVGGAVFIAHPELAPMLGADATAADGLQAVARAEALLSLPRESDRHDGIDE